MPALAHWYSSSISILTPGILPRLLLSSGGCWFLPIPHVVGPPVLPGLYHPAACPQPCLPVTISCSPFSYSQRLCTCLIAICFLSKPFHHLWIPVRTSILSSAFAMSGLPYLQGSSPPPPQILVPITPFPTFLSSLKSPIQAPFSSQHAYYPCDLPLASTGPPLHRILSCHLSPTQHKFCGSSL